MEEPPHPTQKYVLFWLTLNTSSLITTSTLQLMRVDALRRCCWYKWGLSEQVWTCVNIGIEDSNCHERKFFFWKIGHAFIYTRYLCFLPECDHFSLEIISWSTFRMCTEWECHLAYFHSVGLSICPARSQLIMTSAREFWQAVWPWSLQECVAPADRCDVICEDGAETCVPDVTYTSSKLSTIYDKAR